MAAQPLVAELDGEKLIRDLSEKYDVSKSILEDYQKYIKTLTIDKKAAKDNEKKINDALDKIVAFYATQLVRPVMIGINDLSADKKFAIVVNKNTFSLRDIILSGKDARQATNIPTPNKVFEQLESPFKRSLYFANCKLVDVTETVASGLDKYFKANPLTRFSISDFEALNRRKK